VRVAPGSCSQFWVTAQLASWSWLFSRCFAAAPSSLYVNQPTGSSFWQRGMLQEIRWGFSGNITSGECHLILGFGVLPVCLRCTNESSFISLLRPASTLGLGSCSSSAHIAFLLVRSRPAGLHRRPVRDDRDERAQPSGGHSGKLPVVRPGECTAGEIPCSFLRACGRSSADPRSLCWLR
jgi:hypothetical protein